MQAETAETPETPKAVTVAAVSVADSAPALQLTGEAIATRSARLSPLVPGVVQALAVDLGDRVEAGEVLLRLDDELAALALKRLRAERAEAQAQLADARRLADEARRVGPAGGLAQSVVDSRTAQVQVAAATATARSSAAAEQQALVDRHVLRAPFAGVITARSIDLGEWAQPGTPVFSLVDPASIVVDVAAPQRAASTLREGNAARVRGVDQQTVDARISAVSAAADTSARTVRVRLALDTPPPALRAGMAVNVSLSVDGGQTLMVPRDAVLRRPDGTAGIWVVESSRDPEASDTLRAAVRRVTLGQPDGDNIIVRDGLSAGDRVVIRGNEGLQDGQAVRLVSPTGKPADAAR